MLMDQGRRTISRYHGTQGMTGKGETGDVVRLPRHLAISRSTVTSGGARASLPRDPMLARYLSRLGEYVRQVCR
jgi:hypothetical protein